MNHLISLFEVHTIGLSCISLSVGMDFLHSFMSGLPKSAVLEWFIGTSAEPRLREQKRVIILIMMRTPIIRAMPSNSKSAPDLKRRQQ